MNDQGRQFGEDGGDGATPGDRDVAGWIAAEVRAVEERLRVMIGIAERAALERIATARAAADEIVASALREAGEIRAAARGGRAVGAVAEPGGVREAEARRPPGERGRMFVAGGMVEEARSRARDLVLAGLSRQRIEEEILRAYPDLGRERVDAIVTSLLVPEDH